MIEEEKPNIIGHMDKIKMFNSRGHFFEESETWYKDQIRLTIEVLRRRGTIVEVNTRGYYRYNQPDLYPGEWIIGELIKAGIPLMINSDAHKPEEVILGMDYAADKLKNLGVSEVFSLVNNKWKVYPLERQGILIS